MSALGDYVHLTKSKYDKYGINQSGSEQSGIISQQVSIWQEMHNQQKTMFMNFTTIKDPIEEKLQSQMKNYKAFLEGLETKPSMKSQKEAILREVLGDYYETLVKSLRIDLSTGLVQGGSTGTSSLLESDVTDFITRLSKNKERVSVKNIARSGISSINLKHQIVDNWIPECQRYFNSLKGKMTAAEALQKQTEFQKFQEQLQSTINNMKNRYELTKDMFLPIDNNLREAATQLVGLLKILKVPSLNSIRGKIEEVCLKNFYQQGKVLGVTTAVDTIGSALSSGGYNVEFYAPAAKELQSMIKSSKTGISSSYQVEGEDNFKGMLSYNYQSQRKADIILQIDAQDEDEQFTNVGVSVKNYMSQNLGLVSDSALLTFLMGAYGGKSLSMDQINHFLNIFAEISESKDNDFNMQDLKKAKENASNALKLMILYAAASGANVGKGADNVADYILLNVPNPRDKEQQITFVSIKKLIGYIVKNNIAYNVNYNVSKDLSTLSFPNKRINGATPDEGAGKRIANLIMKVHQTKISVAIPKSSIMEAGKNH